MVPRHPATFRRIGSLELLQCANETGLKVALVRCVTGKAMQQGDGQPLLAGMARIETREPASQAVISACIIVDGCPVAGSE